MKNNEPTIFGLAGELPSSITTERIEQKFGGEKVLTLEDAQFLLDYVHKLENENKRLRLVIALKNYKRPRGRPKKAESIIDEKLPKGKRGRPPKNMSDRDLLTKIEFLKKRENISSDKKILEKIIASCFSSKGKRTSRVNDPDVQSMIKTGRTRISKARKSQKQK